MTDEERTFIARVWGKGTTPASKGRAIDDLLERYRDAIRQAAGRRKVSADDWEDLHGELFLAIAKSKTPPRDSLVGWLVRVLEKTWATVCRKRGRADRLVEGAKESARRRSTSLRSTLSDLAPAHPARTPRPLWIVPDLMRASVVERRPHAVVRTWETVNGDPQALHDVLDFDPLILGPAFDSLGPLHNGSRFPVGLRPLERAARDGRSVIILLPPLGHIMGPSHGRWRIDGHVETKQQLAGIAPVDSHEVRCAAPVQADLRLVGPRWGPALDAWAASLEKPRHPTELSFGPGWSLHQLQHHEGSPHALIALGEGPAILPTRALLLPMGSRIDRLDHDALDQFVDLISQLPRLVPLTVNLAGSSHLKGNTFQGRRGAPLTLQEKPCALVHAYLQLANGSNGRVGAAALLRLVIDLDFAEQGEAITRLLPAVNRTFRAFLEEQGEQPYDLLVHEEDTVRLRFPGQFLEVTGTELPERKRRAKRRVARRKRAT